MGPRLRHLRVVRRLLRQLHDGRRASTRSSRATSTSPAARRGPRRCSTASCSSRTRSRAASGAPGVVKPRARSGSRASSELVQLRRSANDPRELVARAQGRGGEGAARSSSEPARPRQAQGDASAPPSSRRTPTSATTPPSSSRRQWKAVCKFLRDDPALDFDMPVDLCGVDYPSRGATGRMEVVMHLYSIAASATASASRRASATRTWTARSSTASTSIWPGAELVRARGLRHERRPLPRPPRPAPHPHVPGVRGPPAAKDYPADTHAAARRRTAPRKRRACRSRSSRRSAPTRGCPSGARDTHPRADSD